LEAANLTATIDFIRQHDLAKEIDLVACNTVDTYMSKVAWDRGYKSYCNFKNAGGNVENISVYEEAEAKKVG
jgi:hypothetical protein